jgi:hypothetical protein
MFDLGLGTYRNRPDLSLLNLTGWYRGSYSALPWVGSASAGASGNRTLDGFVTHPPTTGQSLNSVVSASFNGTNAYAYDDVKDETNYLSTGGYRISFLFYPKTAPAPQANLYDDPGIIVNQSNRNWGISYNSNGVSAWHLDTTYKSVTIACAINSWHAVDVLYDGTTLKLSVDGSAYSTIATALTLTAGRLILIGTNYLGAAFLNADFMDLSMANTALAATSNADLRAYYDQRYGLTL